MLRTDRASEAGQIGERLAARIATDYLLRQVDTLMRANGGDFVKGLIYLAVLSANVRHIAPDSPMALRHAGLNDHLDDDERKPITAHAVSLSLGIPYETVRRYLGKLVADGRCVRVSSKGFIVPAEHLRSEISQAKTAEFYQSARRLVAALHRAGFDIEAMAAS